LAYFLRAILYIPGLIAFDLTDGLALASDIPVKPQAILKLHRPKEHRFRSPLY